MRLAVVGAEMLMATEAGHRVACSAGARVVHVHAGPLATRRPADAAHHPAHVLLLLGGYDGDDPADLLHNAGRLAGARVRFPIVLAAPEAVRDDALAVLRATGRTVVTCENVLPQRGQIVASPPAPRSPRCTGGTRWAGGVRRSGRGSAGSCGWRRRRPWGTAPWSWRGSAGGGCSSSTSAAPPPTSTPRPTARACAPWKATSACARRRAGCWSGRRPRASSTRWRPTCSRRRWPA